MDGPRGYYAKGNTSDRERQPPCDVTYVKSKNKTHTQKTDGCQRGGVGGLGKQGEATTKCKLPSYRNSRGDVKYSPGNTVNDTVIAAHSARRVLDLWGGGLVSMKLR